MPELRRFLPGEDSRYKMAVLSGRAMCVFVVLKAQSPLERCGFMSSQQYNNII